MSRFGKVSVGDLTNFKDESGDKPVLLGHKTPLKLKVEVAEIEYTKAAQKLRDGGDTSSEKANDANIVIKGTTIDEFDDVVDYSGHSVTIRNMFTGEFPARGNEPAVVRANILARLRHAMGDLNADELREETADGVDPDELVELLEGETLSMFAKEGKAWKGRYSSDFSPMRPAEYEKALAKGPAARQPLSGPAQLQYNRDNGIVSNDTSSPEASITVDEW